MKAGTASGLQIAFFTFAALLLVVPLSKYIETLHDWSDGQRVLIGKVHFLMAIAVLWLLPVLRRRVREELARPIPRDRRGEVAFIAVVDVAGAFAGVGALVTWLWLSQDPVVMEQRLSPTRTPDELMAKAFTLPDMAFFILLGAIVGPIIEELVFRGFLYRAWERRWGWIPAMLLSSLLFAAYHRGFGWQFLGGIIYVCLLRRTGTLLAPILVHAIHNLMLWYPLLGRHVLPPDLAAPADIASWPLHLSMLIAFAIILPTYIWMARDARDQAVMAPRDGDAALSR